MFSLRIKKIYLRIILDTPSYLELCPVCHSKHRNRGTDFICVAEELIIKRRNFMHVYSLQGLRLSKLLKHLFQQKLTMSIITGLSMCSEGQIIGPIP